MDSNTKIAGTVTPVKDPKPNRSKISENSNPNVTSPGSKFSKSPAVKSATKSQKLAAKNPNSITSPSPRNKIRERKFVVAKKNPKREKVNSSTVACKCKFKAGGDSQKCLCVAYESLRASQEEFFKSRSNMDDQFDSEQLKNSDGTKNGVEEEEEEKKNQTASGYEGKPEKVNSEQLKNRDGTNKGVEEKEEEKNNPKSQNPKIASGCELKPEKFDRFVANWSDNHDQDEIDPTGEMGSSTIKRSRDKLLEEAREKVPEKGPGRVMHLVKAFEKLLSIPNSRDSDQTDEKESEDDHKVMKWALPGLQPKAPETRVSSSSFCPSDFFLTSESLGLSSSLDSSRDRLSISSRSSGGGRRSRRNSSESCGNFGGRHWKRRQLKATSLKPFKLRTEQRGRHKEEEFIKKVQEIMTEEERQRIPIAQGLPWTTDEPECLVKPPVKEITRPIDLVLHSDVRAVDRAGFDHQVAEKMTLVEQYRMERERQQKLAEEEEIRRLRKELVPKAQPMPYFDRPFIPRRSLKHPTLPREPRFNFPQHKKIKCSTTMSWNDMYINHE